MAPPKRRSGTGAPQRDGQKSIVDAFRQPAKRSKLENGGDGAGAAQLLATGHVARSQPLAKRARIEKDTRPAAPPQRTASDASSVDEGDRVLSGPPDGEVSYYVPENIHKTVDYSRRGTKALPRGLVAAFHHIERYFQVPDDFEVDKRFGPLSGISFEERLVAAYSQGLLVAKEENTPFICTSCGELGHKKRACPLHL